MTRPYTPEELLELIIPHLDKRKMRVRATKDGKHVMARCPFHDDDEPSLSLTLRNGKLLTHCFVCGNVYDRLLELAGIKSATARPIAPRRRQQQQPASDAPEMAQRLRNFGIAELADAKRLDAEKLIAWHVRELPDGGIEILYLTREGELHAVQYRYALEGDNRFKWRKGDTAILYGLWRLCEWTGSDTLYLCEGTSDTWTLWHAELPALGIPGARMWKPEWWREVEGFERIVLIADADDAGAGLAQKLAETCPDHLQERVYVLKLPDGIKDANELWQQVDADPARFREALAGCNIRAIVQTLKELHDCTIARNDSEDDLPLLAPLSELLSSDAEHELEYVPLLGVDGLIARGTLTLLGAHPKAGKTTLLIHACREWLQQNRRVVYLSEDSRPVWRERVKRFPELNTLILNAIPRAHPENWARAVRELEPDIVIVDTIRRFMPPKDENDSASVSLALTPFVDLQQELPRTAIVLVHHTKKSLSSDGEITDIAGSHAFTAEVDAILLLAPVREHKRQRILTPIAGRLWTLSPEPLVLELSEDASEYRVVGTAEEVLPETLAQSTKEKILLALRVLESATVDEIVEYLQEHREHIPKRTIHHHLAQLYTEGAVNREGRGTRAEPYTYSCNRAIVQPLNTLHDCTNSEHSGNRAIGQSLNTLPDCQLREAAQVDAATLFTLAAERGFPALVVEYPDGKSRFHIAGTREGWELALPELERENLLQSAYHALLEPSNAPTAEPLPDLPDLFANRTPLVWDLIDDWLQRASNPEDPFRLEPEELDAVRIMLAYAEARGFPALTLTEYGYTIHGDMAGWLTAAQQLAGTPAIALATRLLHALDASGTPHAPTHNTLLRNGDASLTPSQLSLEEV
jgi:DNA-binding transcriptional ArsR family regulator